MWERLEWFIKLRRNFKNIEEKILNFESNVNVKSNLVIIFEIIKNTGFT